LSGRSLMPPGTIIGERWDLRFRALLGHSSQGGELGEQIAILSTTRVSYAPAEPVLRVLDRIEAASPTNVRRTMNGEIGQ
jgi:hypothetical protein